MKSLLLASLMSSALVAGIVKTNQGDFLEIFSSKSYDSEIIAKASILDAKIQKKNCYSTKQNEEWCRVVYTSKNITLNGYSDKKSLDIISSAPNKKQFFEKTFGGTYDDIANDIIELKDGYLLVGETNSFGSSRSDIYVIKIDKLGNEIYSVTHGGKGIDKANAVVEADDAFMIAGTTTSFGNRTQSLYFAKIAKNGKLIWQRGYFSDKDDYYSAKDIVKISKDNFLIAGTEDHLEFFNSEKNYYINAIDINGKRNGIKRYGGEDPESANSIINVKDGYLIAGKTDTWGHGREDAYVLKIDKDGKKIWHNAYGFKQDEVANEIISTQDGGYMIVGTTNADYKTQKNIYVVKIDSDGKRQWQSFYGSTQDDEGYGIVEVDDGFVMVGYSKLTKNYDKDAYIVKIDRDGKVLWEKRYGSQKDDEVKKIIKVKDGFVLAGYTTSIDNYSKDVYILKVDKNGNLKR